MYFIQVIIIIYKYVYIKIVENGPQKTTSIRVENYSFYI